MDGRARLGRNIRFLQRREAEAKRITPTAPELIAANAVRAFE
jgi:hypothetical protein